MTPDRLAPSLATFLATLLILVGLDASPALGQSADSLSLETVLRAAAEENPRLYASELRTRSLETRADQVQPLPDPTVGVSYFARPIVTARGEQRSQWRIQQAIPTPGTRSLQRSVARLDADGAQARTETVEQSIAADLHDTFYSLYRIQELIRLIERFQADLDQFETVALAQYEAGTEGQPAVLKTQIERQRLDLRLDQLRADYATATQRLANLTGQPSLERMALPVKRPDVPPGPTEPVPTRRPETEALRSDIEKADRRTELARKERWPSFSVGLQYFDIAETAVGDGRDALAVSAGVSLPLWRGSTRSKITEAEINRRRAATNLDAFELEVRTRKAALREQMERQSSQLRQLRETLIPKAEMTVESALSSYQTGKTDFLDVLDAQRTLFQLQQDHAMLFTRYLSTHAEFRYTAGHLSLTPER
jgi:outer membrane protein TolC